MIPPTIDIQQVHDMHDLLAREVPGYRADAPGDADDLLWLFDPRALIVTTHSMGTWTRITVVDDDVVNPYGGIRQGTFLAAVKTLGLDPNDIARLRVDAYEVQVTTIQFHAPCRKTTQHIPVTRRRVR